MLTKELLPLITRVPAYKKFLAEHGIDPAAIRSAADFSALPLTNKEDYIRRFSVEERCVDGRFEACDTAAVSSGSSGEPTLWPRSLSDEAPVEERLEQMLHDSFAIVNRSTLAVVCFPMGTWVGGMYTASCLRRISAKGLPLMTVTPGNRIDEIARVVEALAPSYDQTILFGYPPFLRDVIDIGCVQYHVPWPRFGVRYVFAGEVFSEAWRDMICARVGAVDLLRDSASLYGTADGGILGNETPLSIAIRRRMAANPGLARELFGEPRLPTLVQYDPSARYFEAVGDGTLAFSAAGTNPLFRYHIGDSGGLIGFEEMMTFCRKNGFDPQSELSESGMTIRELPFVYVFGRTLFAVSFYGANIYPENVAVGLEQPSVFPKLSGKFVLEVAETGVEMEKTLSVTVEAAEGVDPETVDELRVADSVRAHLQAINSEFANYVPADRRTPTVQVLPHADPAYFPEGVKHRYTR